MKEIIEFIVIVLCVFGVGFYRGCEHQRKISNEYYIEKGVKDFQELNKLKTDKLPEGLKWVD